MPSSASHAGAGYQPSAHGGRTGRGICGRAKHIHGTLSTPLHPHMDGMGVGVDLPDFVDRMKNGNRFAVGTDANGPQIYKKDNTAGVSLLTMHGATNEDVGIAIDVGTLQCNLDGVGVNYKACGIATSMAIGCVDIGSTLGTAEIGAKVWEPGVGLDVGIKANASAAKLQVGIFNADVGVGIDTGVKCGKEGVGVEVLGTGFQVGRTVGVSLLGSSVSVKLW